MNTDVDAYAWMQNEPAPHFSTYLADENRRFEEVMAPAMPLAAEIYGEIVDRIPQRDSTVPYRFGRYEYFFSFTAEREHPCYFRRRIDAAGEPELLLDYESIAADSEFLDVKTCVNRQSSVLAFAVDLQGDCLYEIRFKDLISGHELPQRLPLATGNMTWSSDGRTLFYSELDPDTLRWHRIKRYMLGSDPALTATVFEETDAAFSCSVYSAKSQEFIFIHSSSGDEDEVHYLAADAPCGVLRVVQGRRGGVEYQVQHNGSALVIRTNLGEPNFRLMTAALQNPDSEHWVELVRPADGAFLEDFEVFRDHVALKERQDGTVRIRVMRLSDRHEATLTFDEGGYRVDFIDNWEVDSARLRYEYSSLVHPGATYEYHLHTGQTVLLKQDVVVGGFDASAYVSERLYVPQADGVSIPLTLLYRKGRKSSPGPVLLYGYGAYGMSVDPDFWLPRFSLVDRGFVFAIAHVRGGGELGRAWHDAGRRRCKPNSIVDYMACAAYLHSAGIVHRQGLFAMGESAGGLLVGAAINERPDLFRAAVAIAPFVDVLNALSDPTLPLTTTDFVEWGDPENPDDYRCIRAYSPYDNVRPQAYPHLLVMSAVHDTQVPVWQAAKWVAKIRDCCTKERVLLLKTELHTGHLGRSGRYAHQWETALAYAFILAMWEGTLAPAADNT